jgi:hypothetical protein
MERIAMSHVEHRVVSNDYTFSFAGKKYRVTRTDVKAGCGATASESNCI